MDLLPAFLLGLLGSFHCIGMCGPIALSLPFGERNIVGPVLYNLGRVVSYAIIGGIVGVIGRAFFYSGVQQYLSIAIGSLIILSFLIPHFSSHLMQYSGVNSITGVLKKTFTKVLQWGGVFSFLGIGIVNGFLPCGFVFLAVAGAVLMQDMLSSIFFMVLFGLGTIPMMLVLSLSGSWLTMGLKTKIRKAVPVITVIIGVLFVLRGLGLGIPYVSPEYIDAEQESITNCN